MKKISKFFIIFLVIIIPLNIQAQTTLTPFPSPGININNLTYSSGTYLFSHPSTITSPSSPNTPIDFSNQSNITYQSAKEIVLKDGFQAHDYSSSGQFLAKINPNLDMVLITPDPATSIINGVLYVPKWEKLELALKLPLEYQNAINSFFSHYWLPGNQVNPATDLNPYAFDSLEVRFDLIKPDGTTQLTRWAFFMRPGIYPTSAVSDDLVEDPTNDFYDYPFRFRFAPDELSNGNPWTFTVTIRNPQGLPGFPQYIYTGFSFICDPPLANNHGFLQVASNNRTLQFENGTPFIAIGTNLADVRKWEAVSPNHYQEYRQGDHILFQEAIEKLASAGGNYIRSWLYKYNFAPEWEHLGVYDAYTNSVNCCPDGSSNYFGRSGNRQWSCWLFDELVEKCRENGVYLQLCLDPSTPGTAYQDFQWGDHTYVRNFVYPTGSDLNNDGIPDAPYNAKEFYITDGVNDRANDGVMYYWKRKYKYIFSRWGYSTNIASFETFNEFDGTLGYSTATTNAINDVNHKFISPGNPSITVSSCQNNLYTYNEDLSVRSTIYEFHDYILYFAQEELDDNKHLFNTSYTHFETNNPSSYHSLFNHPRLDFNDIHNYDDGSDAITNRFNTIQNVLSVFPNNPKPVIIGECSTVGRRTMSDNNTDIDTHNYYENNDVSLHNEIWSSAMSGSMGTGLSWWWENLFWWDMGMPEKFTYGGATTLILGDLDDQNQFTIGSISTTFTNTTSYHQYKPLSDFFSYFDYTQNFQSLIYTDPTNTLEVIYNVPLSGNVGYGWVHNVSNTWHTKWVIDQANNFFAANATCFDANTDIFELEGLLPNEDYKVSFLPTRMSGQTIPPLFYGTAVPCGNSGCLSVDMDFTLGCDSTNSDLAFLITCMSCLQLRTTNILSSSSDQKIKFSVDVFPNPSRGTIILNSTVYDNYQCVIYDSKGKESGKFEFTGTSYQIEHCDLSPGIYFIKISSQNQIEYQKLIIE